MCKLRDDTMSQAGELPREKNMEQDKESGAAVRGEAVAVPATMFHDEGAVACCFYCGRYTLDPAALGTIRVPLCECGKPHRWSGGFKKPGADAKWSGKAPAAPVSARAADAPSEPSDDAMRAVLLNAKAVIQRWDSPLWRQEVHTAEWINQLRKSVELAESRAVDALDSQPTDLSKHLRKIVAECRAVTAQVMVKDITAAAAEIDRYYNGMMAWKRTAEQKDADWNAIFRAPAAQAASVAKELASMERMFVAAASDLGLISEALGLDPDDGGADPILGAIEELKSALKLIGQQSLGPDWTPDEAFRFMRDTAREALAAPQQEGSEAGNG